MKKIFTERIAVIIITLIGIAFCIRQIREPDVWWQIRTGEYIMEHSEVPKVDVFSFTYEGDPWLNVKWFTEVLMAGTVKIFGPENLMLLQMLVFAIVVWLTIKHTKLLYAELKTSALLCALVLFFIAFSFRINGRPEMMSHLWTCVFIYIYQKYRKEGGKLIFSIIALQAIWANMHEAFGVGYVVSGIFVASFWFEKIYLKSDINPIIPTIVMVCSILAVAINPNGFSLIAHPYEIYTQLSENQFTSENLNFTNKGYWQFSSIWFLLFLFLMLITVFSNKKGNLIHHLSSKYGSGYIVLLVAFFYLGLGANRNTPYFMFAVFPLVYEFFRLRIENESAVYKRLVIGGAILYLFIVSSKFYDIFLPREEFGLKVNEQKNAVGAANFLQENNITGKAFTDYFSSSYLLWRLQPEFKTYIDLRDLDVFEPKFMENVIISYSQPNAIVEGKMALWEYMCSIDDFNYVVVLNIKDFINFNSYMVKQEKNYIPVYADGLNTVYLKNTPENKPIIDKYAYKGNQDFFKRFPEGKQNGLAKAITYIFNPFFKDEYTEKRFQQERRAYFKIIN